MRLPAELRNTIYRLAFTGCVLDVHPDLAHRRRWNRLDRIAAGGPDFPPTGPLVLLNACRQTRFEATPIAFSTCIFNLTRFESPKRAGNFLRPKKCQMIRSIKMSDTALKFLGLYVLSRSRNDIYETWNVNFPSVRTVYANKEYSNQDQCPPQRRAMEIRTHFGVADLAVIFE